MLIEYLAEKQHQHLNERTQGTGLTDMVRFYAARFNEARMMAARRRDQQNPNAQNDNYTPLERG
ncbi:MAG: hypothetical protein OHK0046_00690 [Anaerolineae bacterium]